jgi:hypothetical protein
MKKALLVLALVATTASAEMERSPTEYWDISNNRNNNVSVSVKPVDNIRQVCEQQSRSRGFGGFGIPMDACTFWNKDITGYSCTIYVGKKTNNDILGHELRHCLQGSFH